MNADAWHSKIRDPAGITLDHKSFKGIQRLQCHQYLLLYSCRLRRQDCLPPGATWELVRNALSKRSSKEVEAAQCNTTSTSSFNLSSTSPYMDCTTKVKWGFRMEVGLEVRWISDTPYISRKPNDAGLGAKSLQHADCLLGVCTGILSRRLIKYIFLCLGTNALQRVTTAMYMLPKLGYTYVHTYTHIVDACR
jgi:hypothetical protein